MKPYIGGVFMEGLKLLSTLEKMENELVTVCVKHGDIWYNDIYIDNFTYEDIVYYWDLIDSRGAKLLNISYDYYTIGHLIEIDITGVY